MSPAKRITRDVTEEQMKASLVQQIKKQSTLKDADHTLIHIKDPHYKFYQIKSAGAFIEICYGKIGSTGNYNKTEIGSFQGVIDKLQKLRIEKLRKGYEEPDVPEEVAKPVKKKKMTPEGLEKLDAFMSSLK